MKRLDVWGLLGNNPGAGGSQGRLLSTAGFKIEENQKQL